jgi:acyl carrier protein
MSANPTVHSIMRKWLLNQLKMRQIEPDILEANFDLSSNGLLDSFAILELLIAVSEEINQEIDVDRINFEKCVTLEDLESELIAALPKSA